MNHLLKTSLLLAAAWLFGSFDAAAQNPYRDALKIAEKSQQQRKYEDAVAQYRAALDLSPNPWNDIHCFIMIGNSYAALKNFDEALKWYAEIDNLPDINNNARARR